MYVLALAILTGCATTSSSEPEAWDASGITAPPPGDLTLDIEGLAPGHLSRLTVEGAEPRERVFVIASPSGLGDGACPAQMNGSCIDLAGSIIVLGSATANADGRATITRRLPATLSTEMSAGMQAVALRDDAPAPTSIAVEQFLTLPEMSPVSGQYLDSYGTMHTITRRAWNMGDDAFDIVYADGDDESGAHVARNSDDNSYFPGMWSRFDWTTDGAGDTWYCQQAYAEASFDDALAVAAPDDSDPAVTGCGLPPYAFSWTRLDAVSFDLAGEYLDYWGTNHIIDETQWATDWGIWYITEINPTEQFLVAQNDAADSYYPNLWSRFDWTVDPSGHTWYCQTSFSSISEAAAAAVAPADPTNPGVTGCGGFAWTDLTP